MHWRLSMAQALHTLLVNSRSECTSTEDLKEPSRNENLGRLENNLNFRCALLPTNRYNSKGWKPYWFEVFEHS